MNTRDIWILTIVTTMEGPEPLPYGAARMREERSYEFPTEAEANEAFRIECSRQVILGPGQRHEVRSPIKITVNARGEPI